MYGGGKTVEQVVAIVGRIAGARQNVLVTRTSPEVHAALKVQQPLARHHAEAPDASPLPSATPHPSVDESRSFRAGTSDLPVAEEAAVTAEFHGASVDRVHDVGVAGLHRLLAQAPTLRGAHVVIVVAGMEGALPSVVGGLVDAPVVAVPTSVGYGASFHGLAALLAMLNSCASGVAVVNIDNGFGAGYLAAEILRKPRRHSLTKLVDSSHLLTSPVPAAVGSEGDTDRRRGRGQVPIVFLSLKRRMRTTSTLHWV